MRQFSENINRLILIFWTVQIYVFDKLHEWYRLHFNKNNLTRNSRFKGEKKTFKINYNIVSKEVFKITFKMCHKAVTHQNYPYDVFKTYENTSPKGNQLMEPMEWVIFYRFKNIVSIKAVTLRNSAK